MTTRDSPQEQTRGWIARVFRAVEDVVYVGLGLLLAGCALTLLVNSVFRFVEGVANGHARTVELLEQSLMVLLIVELLYTVQVSFRKHALVPEPFLLIGLISVIRRVLVVTAEFGEMRDKTDDLFRRLMIESGVLTVLIVALTVSLVLLRKFGTTVVVKRD